MKLFGSFPADAENSFEMSPAPVGSRQALKPWLLELAKARTCLTQIGFVRESAGPL
jgi:hypothetical protein